MKPLRNHGFRIYKDSLQAVTLAKKFANQTAWQHSSWQDLTNVATKRQLWQQMAAFCQHFEDNHD